MTYAPLQAMWVTPRGHKAVMDFREDTNDFNTITSALPEDEYRLRDYQVQGIAWDIGAHIGSVTIALLLDNPALRVVAVEPIEFNARLLWCNAFHNAVLDRTVVVEAAAGPPGMATTHLHHGFHGSEIAEHHAFIGNTSIGNTGPVDTWRLSSSYESTPVPVVDFEALVGRGGGFPAFIKIDCEGDEYSFLSAPGVADVPVILGEWHNIPYGGRERSQQGDLVALLPNHHVEFSGPVDGPGGFVAVRRG